ncbi:MULTISPECIES: Xaa-Pro peptidase family protein [unclassified Leucobacter]|uniref:M24 family metallopeptidase n=1 Tax=unclassified Leucobacter TaxID=2621730 RepID=UPI00165D6C6C|nr:MULTISPECIES: Xaa-Pro peptidase family protein [unclassified Leucobacter]MBC9936423.1 aminopeptidase P family protein [Leucobacter sp. cx-87]
MPKTHRHLIAPQEYEQRIQKFRELLAEENVDAALVWGRGGGTEDRAADVRYLTGFYPVFPTIRDVAGVWSDRGLCALLVTHQELVLFTDDPAAAEASTGTTSVSVRHGVGSRSMVGDLLEQLDGRPELERIVVVAGDAMSGQHAHALLSDARFTSREVTWNNTLVEPLRMHKSAAEIALMRHAAKIAEEALEAGFALIAPGVNESAVVAKMAEVVARNEAVLANAFVYTAQLEGDDEDNRLPTHSSRPFSAGDLFTVDLSGTYAGYYFDLARSIVVGAEPTPAQQRAYGLAQGAVNAVVAEMRPGAVLGEAARVGSKLLRDGGFDPEDAEFPARGHGLGLGFESPWVRDESPEVLEPGMVISIEQFVFIDGTAATFERNVLITENGPEDLVAVQDFWTPKNGTREA